MTNMTVPTNQNVIIDGVTIEASKVDPRQCSLIRLSFGRFGNNKKVSIASIDVKTSSGEKDEKVDKSRLKVSKELLRSKELEAIKSFDTQVKKYVENVCLPFDRGIWTVPYVAVSTLNAKLKEFAGPRVALVQNFLNEYERQCKDASVKLGSVYRPQDYEPLNEVAKDFKFFWRFMKFSEVPDQLQELDPELWEQEKAKAADNMRAATIEMQNFMRESMAELVDHMVERLGSDPKTGRKKTFRDTLVSNLTEFLGSFDFRNLTNDAELQAVVGQARGLLQGVTPGKLRDSHSARKRVQKGMEELSAKLDTMLVTSGRKINFDED